MIVACGMPELLGKDDADLAEALVVGLQAGEHQVELLVANRVRQRIGDDERVGCRQRVGLDVDGAIGATGERFAQHLRGPSRAGRHDHHFPAVLLLQPQRLFERVGVRLVQFEAGVLVTDPGLPLVHAQLPLARDDLFDTDGDLHSFQLPALSSQLSSAISPSRSHWPRCWSQGLKADS